MICTCINCHKEFKRKPNTKGWYCSNECSREDKAKKANNVVQCTCEVCGKSFTKKTYQINDKYNKGVGRYCSNECRREGAKTGVTLEEYTCKHCGVVFERRPCNIKNPDEIYCSVACRAEGRKNRVTCTCQQCNKNFEVIESTFLAGGGKYCSKNCHDESMKIYPDVECVCLNCNKTFIEKGLRVLDGRGKYCSKECMLTHKHEETETTDMECQYCHKAFPVLNSTLKNWKVKYCSDECRYLGRTEERRARTKDCLHCHKPFIPRLSDLRKGGGKYCSKQCHFDAHAPVTCTCLVCEKAFEVSPSIYNERGAKYCSTECAYIGNTKLVERECEFCHQPFMARPRRLAMGMDRFCSKKCVASHSHVTGSVMVQCHHCHKSFITKKSLVARGSKKYCSRACQNAAPHISGSSHKLWNGGRIGSYGPDWYRQRKAAYERDKGICQCCHRSKRWNERGFHVHHIIKRRSFGTDYKSANALSNLITLCPKCHRRVEAGLIICPLPALPVQQPKQVSQLPRMPITTYIGIGHIAALSE